MDGSRIDALLTHDTLYDHSRIPWHLEYVFIKDGQPVIRRIATESDALNSMSSSNVLESQTTVVHVRQKRIYMKNNSSSSLSVSEHTWRSVLERFEVLPSYLELLHSNNGGTLSHTSYLKKRTEGKASSVQTAPQRKCVDAFHVGYKMGDWGNHEAAIYARFELATGRSFVLLAGTDDVLNIGLVYDLLLASPRSSCFNVVCLLLCSAYELVEQKRWILDYAVQDLEAQTGVSSFRHWDREPLRPEELDFDAGLQVTADFLENTAFGSMTVSHNLEKFLQHLSEYQSLHRDDTTSELDHATVCAFQDASRLKIELARSQYQQIQGLQARIKAQLDITNTLIARRDTQLTIEMTRLNTEIAKATKRDSELMRGIAAVTMVFLPATFVATFFSMVFFHVGDEESIHLTVDHRIWLYPTITIPLTIAAATWYFTRSHGWSMISPFSRRNKAKSISDDEAKVSA